MSADAKVVERVEYGITLSGQVFRCETTDPEYRAGFCPVVLSVDKDLHEDVVLALGNLLVRGVRDYNDPAF